MLRSPAMGLRAHGSRCPDDPHRVKAVKPTQQRCLVADPLSMTTTSRSELPCPTACRFERGAAIVEFALVTAVLFTLIFGLIEGGLLVRANNNVESSTDEAARRGAIAGSSTSADWMVLQQLRVRGLLAVTDVKYVVIYKADSSTSVPSESCRTGVPVNGECNVYQQSDFDLSSSAFGCSDPGLDANWCPTDRAESAGGFEYIGVWVDATHRGLTGIFGEVGIQSQSVLPIEGSGGI